MPADVTLHAAPAADAAGTLDAAGALDARARRAVRRGNLLALALLLVGSLQMVGHVAGSMALRGLGAATAASPYPKVFSDADGYEAFAADFALRVARDGRTHEIPVTPELYARLGGPYNRRNVYGAALSFAPRLPEPLFTAVACHGLAPHGPLRRELGLRPDDAGLEIHIRTRTRGRSDAWTFVPRCTPSPR